MWDHKRLGKLHTSKRRSVKIALKRAWTRKRKANSFIFSSLGMEVGRLSLLEMLVCLSKILTHGFDKVGSVAFICLVFVIYKQKKGCLNWMCGIENQHLLEYFHCDLFLLLSHWISLGFVFKTVYTFSMSFNEYQKLLTIPKYTRSSKVWQKIPNLFWDWIQSCNFDSQTY